MSAPAGTRPPPHNADFIPRFLKAIPACVALGLYQPLTRDGSVALDLPFSAAAAPDGWLDRGALLTLMDQAGANGIYATLGVPLPMTTVEFRADFRDAPIAREGARAHIVAVTRRGALHHAELIVKGMTSGRVLGVATLVYLVGKLPGGGTDAALDDLPPAPADALCPPGARFLDLRATHAQSFALAALPWMVGARMLPAFHGGIVAAALHQAARTAATAAPLAITITYLRPAIAAGELRMDITILRAGRSISVIDVLAWQKAPDRPVAAGRALFGGQAPEHTDHETIKFP